MAQTYEFIDNTKSFSIFYNNLEYTAGKNDVELVIPDATANNVLEIRSYSAKFTSIVVLLPDDTITGVGAGSTTATQLRDALEAIFFLDNTGGGMSSCGSVQNFNLLNIDSGTVGSSTTTLLSVMRSSSDFTVNELGCFVDFDNTATFRLGVYTAAGVLLGETDTITAGALGTGFKNFSVISPFEMSCNVNYFAAVKFINNGSGNGFLLGSKTVLNDSALANISNFSSGDALPNPIGTINSTDVAYYISASS